MLKMPHHLPRPKMLNEAPEVSDVDGDLEGQEEEAVAPARYMELMKSIGFEAEAVTGYKTSAGFEYLTVDAGGQDTLDRDQLQKLFAANLDMLKVGSRGGGYGGSAAHWEFWFWNR